MHIYRNLLILLLPAMAAISCSDEDVCEKAEPTKELVSITQTFGANPTGIVWQKLNFYQNRLINIQYSNGAYDDILYEQEVMSRILKFNSANELEWITTYNYDESLRVTATHTFPGPHNTSGTNSYGKQLSYGENKVESVLTVDGEPLETPLSLTTLNEGGQIIKDELLSPLGRVTGTHEFQYEEGRLMSHTASDDDINYRNTTSFEYMNKAVSDAYNYQKFMFGPHWKNNLAFLKQFGPGQYDAHEMSEGYVTKALSTGSSASIKLYDYVFDAEDNLIKRVENINYPDGSRYQYSTTYEYK